MADRYLEAQLRDVERQMAEAANTAEFLRLTALRAVWLQLIQRKS
jgi:hypothetical protein